MALKQELKVAMMAILLRGMDVLLIAQVLKVAGFADMEVRLQLMFENNAQQGMFLIAQLTLNIVSQLEVMG